ncbi:MAG TPA: helix-turn-helix transcriptional regulator [Acidimicrobiales bacterium]
MGADHEVAPHPHELNEPQAPVWTGDARCRFEMAPPRHFIYPGLLLLLAEQPRHGYQLVDAWLRLGFGPVSRPSVYRALAELEADGLLDSWFAEPTAGSARHVYALSESGRQRLDEWTGVITSERDALSLFLKRFDSIEDD